MRQKTCILIKPDGVGKKVVGKVIDRFEREGLDLVALKLVPPSLEFIETFYSVHKGKPFYPGLLEFMQEGPFIGMAWEGEDAIAKVRMIIGATNSKEAAPGTLRNLYGTDNRRNLVHASDSDESAVREIGLLFSKGEMAALARI